MPPNIIECIDKWCNTNYVKVFNVVYEANHPMTFEEIRRKTGSLSDNTKKKEKAAGTVSNICRDFQRCGLFKIYYGSGKAYQVELRKNVLKKFEEYWEEAKKNQNRFFCFAIVKNHLNEILFVKYPAASRFAEYLMIPGDYKKNTDHDFFATTIRAVKNLTGGKFVPSNELQQFSESKIEHDDNTEEFVFDKFIEGKLVEGSIINKKESIWLGKTDFGQLRLEKHFNRHFINLIKTFY